MCKRAVGTEADPMGDWWPGTKAQALWQLPMQWDHCWICMPGSKQGTLVG